MANPRVTATVGRAASTFEGNISQLDDLHLDAAARELGGEVVSMYKGRVADHVTEVQNAMRGMRNVVSQTKAVLERGSPTAAQRADAIALQEKATAALAKAQSALAQAKKGGE